VSVEEIFGPGFQAADERAKLTRTAHELEAVVLTQLLSAMRRTVPDGGLFKKSVSDDIFRSLLDAELARATAEKSPFGLADAVVKSLENRIKPAGGTSEGPNGKGPAAAGRAPGFRRVG